MMLDARCSRVKAFVTMRRLEHNLINCSSRLAAPGRTY
jgi:hypothetical protein